MDKSKIKFNGPGLVVNHNETEKRELSVDKDDMVGNGKIVMCAECKYYKSHYNIIIAPIENITADGLCLNKHWQSQPIIIDSKKDYCGYYKSA